MGNRVLRHTNRQTSGLRGIPHCAKVALLGASLLGLTAAGCGTTPADPGPTGGGIQTPLPGVPQPSEKERLAALEKLWAGGSGLLVTLPELDVARSGANCEVYGAMVRQQLVNDIQSWEYKLIRYLIRVEKVRGTPNGARYIPGEGDELAPRPVPGSKPRKASAKPAPGTVVDSPIAVGDLVWINVRVKSPDGKWTDEEKVAKGDKLWACFKRFPQVADDPWRAAESTPHAWTFGVAAAAMSKEMR